LPRLLIACCGNASAGDDALGALVATALLAEGLPTDVELLDLGANPTALAGHIDGRKALLVVDAIADDGYAAGELIDCAWPEAREVFLCTASRATSTHGIGVFDQLVLAERLGILPRVVRLLGLTIEHARVGHAPSSVVRAQLPKLVQHVRTVVRELGPVR
jgi:hydrogenase maturation protease